MQDKVGEDAHDTLSHKVLLGTLDESERGRVGTGVTSSAVAGESAQEGGRLGEKG